MRPALAPPVLAAVAAALLPAPAAGAATRTVLVKDDFFSVPSLSVRRGDTVRWVWRGMSPHDVVVTRGPVRFRSKLQTAGTFRKRLTRRGTLRYVCTIHSGMAASIRVR